MASPIHPTGLLFSTSFQRAPVKKIAEQNGASKGQWLVGILTCDDINDVFTNQNFGKRVVPQNCHKGTSES